MPWPVIVFGGIILAWILASGPGESRRAQPGQGLQMTLAVAVTVLGLYSLRGG